MCRSQRAPPAPPQRRVGGIGRFRAGMFSLLGFFSKCAIYTTNPQSLCFPSSYSDSAPSIFLTYKTGITVSITALRVLLRHHLSYNAALLCWKCRYTTINKSAFSSSRATNMPGFFRECATIYKKSWTTKNAVAWCSKNQPLINDYLQGGVVIPLCIDCRW